jgi:MORN repeat variant
MNSKKLILLFFLIGVILISCRFDQNNGITEEYYPDGTIKSQTSLKNGVRNGITKNFDESGRLLSTANYFNDKRDGWVMNYNPLNGKLVIKALYKNDIQEGPVIQYYKEGFLFRESNYVNGRVDGLIKTYWPDGKPKAENIFKMGKPAIGLKEFDKSGKLIDQPSIIVKRLLSDRIKLEICISDGSADVDFYLEKLEDDKYFNPHTHKLEVENGCTILENPVNYGTNQISILAKVKTEYGNTLILQKYFKLL